MTFPRFDHDRGIGQHWVGAQSRGHCTHVSGGCSPREAANPLVVSSQAAIPCHVSQTLLSAALEGRTRNA